MHKVRGAAAALTAAIVIVLGFGAAGSLLAQQPARIGALELKKLYDAGTVVVIDVRTAAAYGNSHIAKALSVPLDTVGQQAASLKQTGKTVVAYCT